MADLKSELNAEVGTFSDALLEPMKLSLGNEASEEIDRYLGNSKLIAAKPPVEVTPHI